MTATITVTTADHSYYSDQGNFRTAVKAGLAGIGVTSGQIVYDSGAHVICKISNGSGTYADNYLRFKQNGNTTRAHSMQMGTGYSSGTDVTGAGIEQAGFYIQSGTYKHRYIKADDGSFGVVQVLDSSDVCFGSYGFIKPTNTTQTAADIPLVIGLGSIRGSNTQTGIYGAAFDPSPGNYIINYGYLRYWDNTGGSYVSINSPGNLRLLFSDTKKGPKSFGALGSSITTFGGASATSQAYFGNSAYSVVYGCHENISGNLPIVPNLPVMSGGVPIGYNSNLVLCPPNLNPGDTIVVSAGTEEYIVISTDGIAIRKV